MKKISSLSLVVAMLFAFSSTAFAVNSPKVDNKMANFSHLTFLQDVDGLTFEDFLTLTPQKFEEKTGQSLNFIEVAKLKIAQKKAAKYVEELNPTGPVGSDDSKLLIYLLCLWIPPLAVYLIDDGISKRFWTNVILTILCGVPGMIHAFIIAAKHFK